jgi:predicted porin
MKKTLLAAALLAGFATAAQAETSVTMYGLIDVGLMYHKISNQNSRFGMSDGIQSGSRWGIRGIEDLGGGLQVTFNLETGFTTSNGGSAQAQNIPSAANAGAGNVNAASSAYGTRLFGRVAWLGLENMNSWGRIQFGRDFTMSTRYVCGTGAFACGMTGTVGGSLGGAIGAADTVRLDNQIVYETPVMSGFQAGISYSFAVDEAMQGDGSVNAAGNGATNNKTRSLGIGLKYSNGPLVAGIAYEMMRTPHGMSNAAYVDSRFNAAAINPGRGTPQSIALGLAYDFEVVKVHAAYAHTIDASTLGSSMGGAAVGGNNPNWNNAMNQSWDGLSMNGYSLGVTVPIGKATKFLAQAQLLDPSGRLGDGTPSMQLYNLAITHELSKRTNLYAIAGYARHWGFDDDTNARSLAVGLRHQF